MTPVDVAGGPRRASPRHLTLLSADMPAIADVPVLAEADGTEEDDNRPADPKHRKPDSGASRTRLSLMALGAIAAALGISSAQAIAYSPHPKARMSTARPDDEAAPETSHLPVTDPPKAPVIGTSIPKMATKAAIHPADESSGRPVESVAYTLPQGTGKHRKPAVATPDDDFRGHVSGHAGKHRGHDDSGYDRGHHGPWGEWDGWDEHRGWSHPDHDEEQAEYGRGHGGAETADWTVRSASWTSG